jgi:hypothetical protein
MIDRDIRRSVMKRLREMFETPTNGWNAFTVYGEEELKLAQSGMLAPERPCLFLIDSYIRPVPAILPLCSVEVFRTQRRPFELGNHRAESAMIWVRLWPIIWGRRWRSTPTPRPARHPPS